MMKEFADDQPTADPLPQCPPGPYPGATSGYDDYASPADTGGGQDSGNSCPAPDTAPVDSGGACAS
ncbi:hypothetical protein [Amycolatopsis japonica]